MAKKGKIIHKSTGEPVQFSRKKVERSLIRSGASKGIAKEVSKAVESAIRDGMSTSDVYKKAFALLKDFDQRPVAARYSLRDAIQQLGPTGFPFEQFVAEILRRHGYTAETGKTIKGKCVTHEVDVYAHKGDEFVLVECKFHNQHGYANNVKIPLYIHSRFLDIEASLWQYGPAGANYEPWVVSNTGFSEDAKAYAACVGIKLIGWRYPETGGIEKLVEDAGLHPVTVVTSLTAAEKEKLVKDHIILCKDVLHNPSVLDSLNMSQAKQKKVLSELRAVCEMNNNR